MKKRCMLIIPHQDDELFVGGSVLYEFANDINWEVFVVYTTEGAGIYEEPETRMKEAIKALHIIGIPENNIIFLGYGNVWSDGINIYNKDDEVACVSKRGGSCTYALKNHQDFSYLVYGEHSLYTRNNYKRDIKKVIMDIYPDVVIGVDMDDHQEHMATSLLLDECMSEILKDKEDYCPLFLKKFAYDGLWRGEDDYFNLPRKETLNNPSYRNKTRNPMFQWDERIRFAVPPKCNTIFLFRNILYKAAKQHRSQSGWLCALRIINSDAIYWYKRTDNIALCASTKVSSGNASFINDFKVVDTNDVTNKDTKWCNCTWFPEQEDEQKRVDIKLNQIKDIQYICIYESPEKCAGEIKNMHIEFDDGFEFDTGELIHGGCKNLFDLKRIHSVQKICLVISDYVGKPGIAELELYKKNFEIEDYNIPCHVLNEDQDSMRHIFIRRIVGAVEKKLVHLKYRLLEGKKYVRI